MKKTLITVVALVCALFVVAVSPAFAASGEMRVGYVDIQKALATSKAGKKAKAEYDAEVKKAQAELDEKTARLKKLQEAFVKQQASLNDEARQAKEEELRSLEKDLKRSYEDSKESLRRKNQQIVGELVNRIREVVQQVGEGGEYTVILERRDNAVLYADETIDITGKVVKKFDATS